MVARPRVPASKTLERQFHRMATSNTVKGPASYFPSIESKYGKPISHWMDVLRLAGPLKHMEYVALLKTEHGLGHGHANALVAAYLDKRK